MSIDAGSIALGSDAFSSTTVTPVVTVGDDGVRGVDQPGTIVDNPVDYYVAPGAPPNSILPPTYAPIPIPNLETEGATTPIDDDSMGAIASGDDPGIPDPMPATRRVRERINQMSGFQRRSGGSPATTQGSPLSTLGYVVGGAALGYVGQSFIGARMPLIGTAVGAAAGLGASYIIPRLR